MFGYQEAVPRAARGTFLRETSSFRFPQSHLQSLPVTLRLKNIILFSMQSQSRPQGHRPHHFSSIFSFDCRSWDRDC
ncbi:hypothetical protein NPIL_633461 [Nephila pilipes]|uniref:Uncharacterized protein n=1 Tax=Nephila pilipes TaxID=299642 RepID=A0A8X6JBY1_NEPPI|nr:hypothetical protein NPIL_633461 [Nephila pilipes]